MEVTEREREEDGKRGTPLTKIRGMLWSANLSETWKTRKDSCQLI